MTRARNPNGTFKSCLDDEIERHEAEFHAEIKAKMNEGLSFDEAWIACGGDIIATLFSKPEDTEEVCAAYAKVGRPMPRGIE